MNVYDTARLNMVESQIRPNQVTDRRILRAMLDIPRELFVPAAARPLAYMDHDLPLQPGSTAAPPRHLMAPMPLAQLIQLANISTEDLVLDIGCATGYSTTILARLAEAVVGLEEDPELAETAAKTLNDLGVDNAAIITGKLNEGYAEEGPYDAILLGGSVAEIPDALLEQLKDGGRLVAIIADGGLGKATLFESVQGDISRRPSFDAGSCRLPGFEPAPAFIF